MEILKILEGSGKDLYLEDLDFFETELATGGPYDADYREKCESRIHELRAWLNSAPAAAEKVSQPAPASGEKEDAKAPKGVMFGLGDVIPEQGEGSAPQMKPEELVFHDIRAMREAGDYKVRFKQYVSQSQIIDAAFVDAHFSFFRQWELDTIVAAKQLGEAFLEKYFDALDHGKIARHQVFSESFFMKHFPQLDATVVLKHGKNDWRSKKKRSKQLDVFLRLKGVRL